MNKKITIIVVVVIVLLGVGILKISKESNESYVEPNSTTANRDASSNNTAVTVQETNMITYKGFAIVQKSIKVKKGTTVTWTNEDSAKHDVTPDKETDEFKASELFGKGETHSATFNTVGTYTYHCSPHPYMKGTIDVVE